MVAIFIMSVGLLAVSALQLISKQSNFEAIQRTHAASLAYDLFERMRLNADTEKINYTVADINASHPSNQPSVMCDSTACSPSQLTTWDLYNWQQMLIGASEKSSTDQNVGGLLDPTACISRDDTLAVGAKYDLTIVWRGQANLTDTHTSNTCGSGLYGTDNVNRRILVFSTYMNG